jgi:predicted transcriptional regulator
MNMQKISERLTVRVSSELQRRVNRALANSGHLTVSDLVRDALEQYLPDRTGMNCDGLQDLQSEMARVLSAIETLNEIVSRNDVANALDGLIDHAILPMVAQDRKQPIIAIQIRLKGSLKC